MAEILNAVGKFNRDDPIILKAVGGLIDGPRIIKERRKAIQEVKDLPAKIVELKKALEEARLRLWLLESPAGIMESRTRERVRMLSNYVYDKRCSILAIRRYYETGDGYGDSIISLVKYLENPRQPIGISTFEKENGMTGTDARVLFDAICTSLNFTLEEAKKIYAKYKIVGDTKTTNEKVKDVIK